MDVVDAASVTAAWLAAARGLAGSPRQEAWDLVVRIRNPHEAEGHAVQVALDRELRRLGKQRVSTVANTLFPELMWQGCQGDRERLYARYARALPRLRRLPGNRRGMYFERLTRWPGRDGQAYNQLEAVIERLRSQLASPRTLRMVYDLAIFAPDTDRVPRGFPCLAYINVKLVERRLRLTAHYRNHYFVERAYGNYLGLARLQRFIAAAAGIETDELICVSGHAQLDHWSARLQDVLIRTNGGS